MSEENVSTPQPADGSEMDAGDVPARQSAEPSAGTKRKRLPENADGQSDDIIADDEIDDVHRADVCQLEAMVQRRLRLQKENVGRIRRSLTDMKLGIAELQKKLEINRCCFLRELGSSYQKCQEGLKDDAGKLDKLFDEQQALKCNQSLKDALSKLNEDRERLLKQYEESRESDESLTLSFAGKIVKLEKALIKRDKDDKHTAKLAIKCLEFLPRLSVLDSTIA